LDQSNQESSYTKHERAETPITINFVIKVALILGIEPLQVLMASPKSIFEGVSKASKSESIKKNELSTIIEGIMVLKQELAVILEK
jgi:hypothetical protein